MSDKQKTANTSALRAPQQRDGGAVSQDDQFTLDVALKITTILEKKLTGDPTNGDAQDLGYLIMGQHERALAALRTSQQQDGAREPLQCLICGAKHSGWSKADLEEWQKLISPLRQQGRHPYGTQSPQQPSSERDLVLLVEFGNYLGEKWRDKQQAQFGQWPMEVWAKDFLASRQEKNNEAE